MPLDITQFDFGGKSGLQVETELNSTVQTIVDYVNNLPANVGSEAYVHNQTIASSNWIINHNLNRQVIVQVYDVAGREIIASIDTNNLNQCIVTTNTPTTGTARII